MPKSINVTTINESICDYHWLRKRIIKDNKPKRKKGLAGYWVEAFFWDGKKVFLCVLDAWWFCETSKEFDNLRDASNWLKQKIS